MHAFVLVIMGVADEDVASTVGVGTVERLELGGARVWEARVSYPAEEGTSVNLKDDD